MRTIGYRLASYENAIKLLRPDCKFTFNGVSFIEWNHEDPPPTMEEMEKMIQMIRDWEDENPDKVNKVWI
jgi:hypothetical protein